MADTIEKIYCIDRDDNDNALAEKVATDYYRGEKGDKGDKGLTLI